MNSAKNGLIVILALTTLGGAALAWRQYQELVELRAAALNGDERAEWKRKVADLQRSLRERDGPLAALPGNHSGRVEEQTAGDRMPAAGENHRDRGPRGGREGPSFSAMREIMARPEVQAMITSTRKAALDQPYAALFRMLALSPEQTDQLKSLLVERQNSYQDVIAAAREQGIDPRTDGEAVRKLVSDAQSAVNDGIRSLLGENGYAQFANYEQTMPQRTVVAALQQRLASSDAPLSASQADQLVQILASSPPAQKANAGVPDPALGHRGGGDFGGRFGGAPGGFSAIAAVLGPGSAPITTEAVSQAQAILTPPQLDALQQLQQQQQTAGQLHDLLRSSFQPNAASGSTTPPPAAAGVPGQPTRTRSRPGG